MSFDIEGWVEISRFRGEEQRDEFAWRGAIRLGTIIDTSDDFSEQFFGLSRRCVSGEKVIMAVFANRGIPPNPSQEVRTEIDVIMKHEQQYGQGEYGGYTYALWRELKNIPGFNVMYKDSDWNTVMNMIDQLEKDYRFSDEQIRLVIWFCW